MQFPYESNHHIRINTAMLPPIAHTARASLDLSWLRLDRSLDLLRTAETIDACRCLSSLIPEKQLPSAS